MLLTAVSFYIAILIALTITVATYRK